MRVYSLALALCAACLSVTDNPEAVQPVAAAINAYVKEQHLLEAELSGSVIAPMQVAIDAVASNGEYLHVPNGAGMNGSATFSVQINTAGVYRLWGRFLAPNSGDDSVFLQVDGASNIAWHVTRGASFTWSVLKDAGTVVDLALAAGAHTIRIGQREDGTGIDKLLLTADADYVPLGSVGDAENVFVHSIEAEAAVFTAPFETAADAYASGGYVLHVPDTGTSNADTSGAQGVARFDFNVPRTGSYYLWARVLTPSGASDSFFVRVDDGAPSTWQIGTSTEFRNRRLNVSGLNPVSLAAGAHTLAFYFREDGAQLDKLIISDGRGYLPGVEVIENPIAAVWSGARVGFDLLTEGNCQAIAYYAANRHMTVATRVLPNGRFRVRETSNVWNGWDSHNSIAMTMDADGQLHVAGNFHRSPLANHYFRTTKPCDATTLTAATMLGTQEASVTYPKFLRDPLDPNDLLFIYRDGSSGDGDYYINHYDNLTHSWTRLSKLLEGQPDDIGAYPQFVLGPDGVYHVAFVWRENGGAENNSNLSYVRSADFRNWQTATGAPLTLPLRRVADPLADPKVIDPVPVGGGLLNSLVRVGFDWSNHVIVSYHRYVAAESGERTSQLFNARLIGSAWQIVQTSQWACRYDFSGGGSLPGVEVGLGPVTVTTSHAGERILAQTWRSCDGTSGTWQLEPFSLWPQGSHSQPGPLPGEVTEVEPAGPPICGIAAGMPTDAGSQTTNSVLGRGSDPSADKYFARWLSLTPNRDLPREDPPGTTCVPPPSVLRLYRSRE